MVPPAKKGRKNANGSKTLCASQGPHNALEHFGRVLLTDLDGCDRRGSACVRDVGIPGT